MTFKCRRKDRLMRGWSWQRAVITELTPPTTTTVPCTNETLIDKPNKKPPVTAPQKDYEKVTQRNQLKSRFMRLPAEIRNPIYELTSLNGAVVVRNLEDEESFAKGMNKSFTSRESSAKKRYRCQGAFSLLLTCRQIRYEAARILYTNHKFDLTAFKDVKYAVEVISTYIAEVVQTIQITCQEARMVQMCHGGRWNHRERIEVYDVDLIMPSLQRLEVVFEWKMREPGIRNTINALRVYFVKENLEVDIQKAPFLLWKEKRDADIEKARLTKVENSEPLPEATSSQAWPLSKYMQRFAQLIGFS